MAPSELCISKQGRIWGDGLQVVAPAQRMLLWGFRLVEEQLTRRMQGWEHPEPCPSTRRSLWFWQGQKRGWRKGGRAGVSHWPPQRSQGGNSFSRNERTTKEQLRAWCVFPLRNVLGGFSLHSAPRADISQRFKSS